jgi:predicted dithiol-disulfide oxidoreductase (DUF899 family)
MFDPSWDAGCPSCSFLTDNIGHLAHLHARKTTLALVSRAPLNKIEPYRRRMGWTIPWYSSFGSDFNYDFHVTLDETVAPVEYNYTEKAALLAKGESYFTEGESHGLSVFLREGDSVYHTSLLSKLAAIRPVEGAISSVIGRDEAWAKMRFPGSAVPISQGSALAARPLGGSAGR